MQELTQIKAAFNNSTCKQTHEEINKHFRFLLVWLEGAALSQEGSSNPTKPVPMKFMLPLGSLEKHQSSDAPTLAGATHGESQPGGISAMFGNTGDKEIQIRVHTA